MVEGILDRSSLQKEEKTLDMPLLIKDHWEFLSILCSSESLMANICIPVTNRNASIKLSVWTDLIVGAVPLVLVLFFLLPLFILSGLCSSKFCYQFLKVHVTVVLVLDFLWSDQAVFVSYLIEHVCYMQPNVF